MGGDLLQLAHLGVGGVDDDASDVVLLDAAAVLLDSVGSAIVTDGRGIVKVLLFKALSGVWEIAHVQMRSKNCWRRRSRLFASER